jgi:stress response protein YsnF
MPSHWNDCAEASEAVGVSRAQEHPEKLQLFAEELTVTKETSETGRVRIATHTHERKALVDENLLHQHAEIETVPVGRRVEVTPGVRHEDDVTIVPVVEEVLYTERRLMLKEEIRIKLVRTTERHQETVVLRHQEAVVTRHQAEKADAPSSSRQTSTELEKATSPSVPSWWTWWRFWPWSNDST